MSGGANRSMLQLILELRQNHDVKPIVLAPFGKIPPSDKGLVNECRDNNITVIRSVIPWFVHNKVFCHRIKYLLLFFYYPILICILKKYNIQLIHSNASVFDLGAKLSKSLGVPHIWHFREFGTENSTFKPVRNYKYITKLYAQADKIIAISHAIKHSYETMVDKKKVVVIYNGIDVARYNICANHTNNIINFVIVGIVTPHKNQMEAIKAAAVLLRDGITQFHINIIGQENTEYKTFISNFIRGNGLTNYVTFWGIRDDVPTFLSKMDVGLMLSKSEAFGRVTIEYMFQNLAVIASDTGANPELINNNKTGLLYHYGNCNDLAEKMKMIILDKSLLSHLSSQGRIYARKEFCSTKNSDNIYRIYEEVIKSNK